MTFVPFLLLAALIGATAPGAAADDYRCSSTNSADCPPPPPPLPPMPPTPPAPPPMPEVPAGAHAACSGKATGTRLTYVVGKGKTMTGTCQKEGKSMVFELESYQERD